MFWGEKLKMTLTSQILSALSHITPHYLSLLVVALHTCYLGYHVRTNKLQQKNVYDL